MDIELVRQGLADAADAIDELHCFGYVPDSIPEPCFYPLGPETDFDRTFQRGMDEIYMDCMLLVSRAEDKAGQQALDRFLAGSGEYSLKAALEGTPGVAQTLGGACHDVHVVNQRGYRMYKVGATDFYGAKIRTHIIGPGG